MRPVDRRRMPVPQEAAPVKLPARTECEAILSRARELIANQHSPAPLARIIHRGHEKGTAKPRIMLGFRCLGKIQRGDLGGGRLYPGKFWLSSLSQARG